MQVLIGLAGELGKNKSGFSGRADEVILKRKSFFLLSAGGKTVLVAVGEKKERIGLAFTGSDGVLLDHFKLVDELFSFGFQAGFFFGAEKIRGGQAKKEAEKAHDENGFNKGEAFGRTDSGSHIFMLADEREKNKSGGNRFELR